MCAIFYRTKWFYFIDKLFVINNSQSLYVRWWYLLLRYRIVRLLWIIIVVSRQIQWIFPILNFIKELLIKKWINKQKYKRINLSTQSIFRKRHRLRSHPDGGSNLTKTIHGRAKQERIRIQTCATIDVVHRNAGARRTKEQYRFLDESAKRMCVLELNETAVRTSNKKFQIEFCSDQRHSVLYTCQQHTVIVVFFLIVRIAYN